MRVSAETKAATRERILDAAGRLFAEQGFGATTTRDIARAADIASGTLFNYFPTKEAIVAALADEAAGRALVVASGKVAGEALEEDLFALITAGLRQLAELRQHLPALLETWLNPLVDPPIGGRPASFRTGHLEAVARLAARHGLCELSPTALQLYWTLYTGVLAFWAGDRSPKQEDTLALIDDSLDMFVAWLRTTRRAAPDDRNEGLSPCPPSPS
jgi:AcrR family transcriptional regulator